MYWLCMIATIPLATGNIVELLHQCKGNVSNCLALCVVVLLLFFCVCFLLIFYMLINHLLKKNIYI